MRTFTIPGPPADLEAVKDWRGYIWIRDGEDMFMHQYPDAETPERRSWRELIEEGPLIESVPKIQNFLI